jgi:hypothetical protein
MRSSSLSSWRSKASGEAKRGLVFGSRLLIETQATHYVALILDSKAPQQPYQNQYEKNNQRVTQSVHEQYSK